MTGRIKIRTLSDGSIITTIILASLCAVIFFFSFQKYIVLRNATQDYISCEKAAHKLQEGSDMLTKQVRLAAATGKQQYIDAYFNEADITKTREKSLEELASLHGNSAAIAELQKALMASVDLMQTEYYAMRLVEEATATDEYTWPSAVRNVNLSAEDSLLSGTEKLNKAQKLVIDTNYENAKDIISQDVNLAINSLTKDVEERQNQAAGVFANMFKIIVVCVLIFAMMMLCICMVMRYWIVNPLIAYGKSIQHGSIFPIHGADELRALARTYNKVYKENEEYEMLLKHRAEHDPLTELLNRGSFDRILKLYQDKKSNFALILMDVDTFKSVNDTYGHAVGDNVLKKVADHLTTAFRTIDYACRIGGDEFAVIMVEMTRDLGYIITDKMAEINRRLSVAEENIPAVSLSAGVAFFDGQHSEGNVFKNADSALYYTKEHEKGNCHIYSVS